ncbi:hypothetical protein [Natronomonas sp.]|uniref:DUF7311 family protein n=1 Tax=Natronomonas sp. TaxID=2184060 RepID=UPI003974B69F
MVLGSALFGVALPSAEHADRDRATALALDELERVNEAASRLAAENDPVDPSETPPATTVTLDPPQPMFVDPGRIRIGADELRWLPPRGRNRTIEPTAPLHVETPIVVSERARVRLSLVRLGRSTMIRVRLDRTRV